LSRYRRTARLASQWFLGVALVIVLVLFFGAIVGLQLTSRENGERIHRRAVASLTDLDTLLPQIERQLHEDAGSGDSKAVPVRGFPIPLEVPRSEAGTLSGAPLRQRLLDEAARKLYDDGMSPWIQADSGPGQGVQRFSAAGAIYHGLAIIRDSYHKAFLVAAVWLGLMVAGLAAALAMTLGSWCSRLLVLGSAVFAGALPSLAAAVAIRFAFKTAQSDADSFADTMLDLGVDAMWIPIRTYLALTVLGMAVAGMGGLGVWLQSRGSGREATYVDAAPL